MKEDPETLKYLLNRKNIGFKIPLCGVGKHLTAFKVRLQDITEAVVDNCKHTVEDTLKPN